MPNLKRIEAIGFSRMTSAFDRTFAGAYALEEIGEIRGNISFNGFNVNNSSKLTRATLIRILNALADKTSDTSGTTWKITLGETNIAKLTEEEQQIATSKGWVIA